MISDPQLGDAGQLRPFQRLPGIAQVYTRVEQRAFNRSPGCLGLCAEQVP